MCILQEPTSRVWCPHTVSTASGEKKGDLGEIPPSVSPSTPLFCPVDEQGMPTGASRNSPIPAVGGRRAGAMLLGPQHKERLKAEVLGPFNLGAMGCANPSDVLCFPAFKLWHCPHHPSNASHIHSQGDTSVLHLLPQCSFIFLHISHYIDFSPSLAPFNPVLEVQTLNICSLNVAQCSQ